MITKIRKQMKQLTAESSRKILAKLLKDMSSLVTGVCAITCFMLIGVVLVLEGENLALKKKISSQINYNTELENRVANLESELKNQKTEYEKLAKVSVDLDTQNKELVDQINSQNEELEKLEARAELYDKYEYAIVREDNTRTDITYEEIDTLESLAKERNMGEDAVTLVMAIAMNESNGIEDAKNPDSTATVFGGLLAGTAKYIYENEMDSPEGDYNHKVMAKDGELNLQISLCLVDYLADQNNRNPIRTVNNYRGLIDKAYLAKLDNNLAKVNKTLNKLNI